MRFLSITIFLICFSISAFSQTEQEKVVSLSALKVKGTIVKQEFSNIPQEVRDFHARGQFRYFIIVDKNGKVKEIKPLSEFSKRVDDYLTVTIKKWQFKALDLDGEKVSYKTVILIPFCYGSFSRCSY
ncbi:MAG: hypothetical protein ACR2F2_01765 [Pyrinomonadaceae bacterium]